jgi:DNA-binding transcriptional MerR regulator
VTEPEPQTGEDQGGPVGSRPVYSIGAVVKMLGLDASTLRAWEERYGLVVPRRSRGGQRIYSRDDLAQLRFVLEAIGKGASPGDAHRLLAEQRRAGAVTARREQAGPNVMVLLAERDRYAAELSEYLLRSEGYDVCVVFDPGEAKRCTAERQPDLSMIELMMPGGGLALCRELAQLSGTPVLALSSLDLAEEALAAGAGAFVSKPINPFELVSTVRDLLGQSTLTATAGVSASS